MKISQAGLDLIKRFEGCELEAYQDAVGIWTIGYGHTGSDVHKGLKITQAQADAGFLKKPYASFTILGVGNSPGIHVIAFGGILMGLGIPWAFYIKPWLVQREKRRIMEQVKAGTYVAPGSQRAVAASAGAES